MTFWRAIRDASQNYPPGARRGKHLFTYICRALSSSLHFRFAQVWTLRWSPWALHFEFREAPGQEARRIPMWAQGKGPSGCICVKLAKACSAGHCGARDRFKRICSGIWEVHFKGLLNRPILFFIPLFWWRSTCNTAGRKLTILE